MKTISLADGRQLSYRDSGTGRPLVLLHGWAMASAVFQEMIELLSEDFRVLAPDLRGHGHSEGKSGYRLDDFTDDLLEWLAALGLAEVDLFGWSLGGQVALCLQQRAPDRIGRLGLIGSTPRFVAGNDWTGGLPEGQVLAMDRNLKRNYLKAMGEFFDLQFAGEGMTRSRYRDIVDFAVRKSRLPGVEVAREALGTLRDADLRSLLADVSCRTLVMHGELDSICPVAAGRALADAIPRAKLVLVSGLGHAPFLSKPGEVARCWREYLQ